MKGKGSEGDRHYGSSGIVRARCNDGAGKQNVIERLRITEKNFEISE